VGGRRIVYKESAVGVGGFPFLLSLLVLLYSKSKLRLLSCLNFMDSISSAFCLVFDITFELPISPTPDPAHYIQYFSLEMIGQRVIVNTIDSKNCFATSQVAFWCWETM
jgi:hypothetical protein